VAFNLNNPVFSISNKEEVVKRTQIFSEIRSVTRIAFASVVAVILM
jgi:hypothetical protein